jgi:hypothetical protein
MSILKKDWVGKRSKNKQPYSHEINFYQYPNTLVVLQSDQSLCNKQIDPTRSNLIKNLLIYVDNNYFFEIDLLSIEIILFSEISNNYG